MEEKRPGRLERLVNHVYERRNVYGAATILLLPAVALAWSDPTDPRTIFYLALVAILAGTWASIAFKGWRAKRGLARLRAKRAADRSPLG